MTRRRVADDFYKKVKSRLYRRIGRELRLAYRVLDLGCGGCELAQFLNKTYRQRVIGVEISHGKLPREDNATKGRAAVKCVRADAAKLDFLRDASVDAVVSVWAVHEMDDPVGALREARRVLRPGGEILVLEFPRGSLAQRLWNEKYYSASEVDRMLKRAGFDEVLVRAVERRQVIWAKGYRRPCEESEQ